MARNRTFDSGQRYIKQKYPSIEIQQPPEGCLAFNVAKKDQTDRETIHQITHTICEIVDSYYEYITCVVLPGVLPQNGSACVIDRLRGAAITLKLTSEEFNNGQHEELREFIRKKCDIEPIIVYTLDQVKQFGPNREE